MKLNDRGAGKVDSCDLWCHSEAEIGVIRNFAIFFAIIRNLDIWCCRVASQSHSWKSNRNFERLKKMFCSFFLHRTNNAVPTFFNAAAIVLFHLGSGGRFEGLYPIGLGLYALSAWRIIHIKDARVCSKTENRKPLQFQEITIKQDWDPTTGNGLTNFRG